MSLTEPAKRLREMAGNMPSIGQRTRAALLAGAAALEREAEATGALRQIASGQSWNPQRDAEEALAKMEAL
jgi:hypothetical protein